MYIYVYFCWVGNYFSFIAFEFQSRLKIHHWGSGFTIHVLFHCFRFTGDEVPRFHSKWILQELSLGLTSVWSTYKHAWLCNWLCTCMEVTELKTKCLGRLKSFYEVYSFWFLCLWQSGVTEHYECVCERERCWRVCGGWGAWLALQPPDSCGTTIIAMRIQRFFSTVQFVDKSMQ